MRRICEYLDPADDPVDKLRGRDVVGESIGNEDKDRLMNYHIHPIPALKDNYIWLLAHRDTAQALVVDPGDAAPVLAYLQAQELTLTAILITHHHADHTGGIAALKAHYDVPVYASIDSQHPLVTHKLAHGDALHLPLLDLTFQTIAIPGHTLDHMAFYSQPIVFTGDTLFSAGCGRLFEGKPAQMFDSLQRLCELPDDTKLYCGHEYTLSNLAFAKQVEPNNQAVVDHQHYVDALRAEGRASLPSTLALEKQINPFLRAKVPTVIQAASQYAGKPLSEAWQVFAALREWKNSS